MATCGSPSSPRSAGSRLAASSPSSHRHHPRQRSCRDRGRTRRQSLVRRAGCNRIGRITTAGVVTEFAAGISANSSPEEITVGADGNLWFTEFDGNRIGRLDLPLTAAGTTVNTTEGQPFNGIVATFTDGDPSASRAASRPPSTGATAPPLPARSSRTHPGNSNVSGTHTYLEEGSAIPISVTIADKDGSTATSTAPSTWRRRRS